MKKIFTGFVAILAFFAAALANSAGEATDKPFAKFRMVELPEKLSVGYAVLLVDVNGDGKKDIVVVDTTRVIWFENPTWTKHVIAGAFTQMINTAVYDTDGDGIPEIALAHGFSMNPSTSTGVITILTHLGDPTNPWIAKEIDRVPTTHRIRWVDIDGSG